MPIRRGWGFDFEWIVDAAPLESRENVEEKMGECIDAYMRDAEVQEESGADVSQTQEKKRAWEEKQAKRATKSRAKARRKAE